MNARFLALLAAASTLVLAVPAVEQDAPKAEGAAKPALTLQIRSFDLTGLIALQNAGLRLFAAQGWYDFATPFFGAEYSLKRPGIPQERITWKYYDAGHMMYVRDEDRAMLSAVIRAVIRAR